MRTSTQYRSTQATHTPHKRAGRKRKINAKRRISSRIGRKTELTMTPEQQLKKKALLGLEVNDNSSTDFSATGSPLMLLLERGMLGAMDDRLKAEIIDGGHSYGCLYWSCWGVPFANTPYYGEMYHKTGLPQAVAERMGERQEQYFKEIDDKLKAMSRGARQRIHDLVVDFNLPSWFERATEGKMTARDHQDRDGLIYGLMILRSLMGYDRAQQ